MGCYIWYSDEGPGRAAAPPSPLLAVPNETAHPSTVSVAIIVLLYDSPLFCGFNVAIKGLKDLHVIVVTTRSALCRAHLPPTTVFRRFETTRCCFDGPPLPVRACDFPDVIKFHVVALQCIWEVKVGKGKCIYIARFL